MPTSQERLTAALADRYRLEHELGAGGMATVYLAADLKHDRQVALKVLKPELAAVLGAERFVVEIKTTASLSHPHILPLFDSGSADGFLYYVMPYIDGETLRDKLNRETQLGVEESIRVTTEVADALDYAHRRGVIHRDIKPENILLHDGRPLVADFGIALAVSAAAGGRMTETGLSLGTPHYMSPEQATADKEISARSDVYSLASVLYEMLAGQPPHQGGSAQQVIMKIIAEEVKPVTEHRRTVPPHVAAALTTALEKLPADRFESARAFREALLNPGYATAAATGLRTAAGTSAAARRQLVAATGVAAVATVLAGWGWLRPRPPALVSRFALALPDSQALAQPPGFRLAVSPDGRKIVYAGGGSRAPRLYVRELDQLTATPLPGTEGGYNPAFSPTGEQLAFVAGSRRALKVLSLSGGQPITLTDSLVDNGGIAWSPDGYIYYDAHMETDGLGRVLASGGRPEVATRTDAQAGESWHSIPAALPNRRGLLFTIARQRGQSPSDVAVLDLRTGKHQVLFRGSAARYAPSGHLVYALDDGTLMAASFDANRLKVTGTPVAIASGVENRGLGRADIDISSTGLLVYAAGMSRPRVAELVWVTRDGEATAVDPNWQQNLFGSPTLSPDGKAAAVTVGSGNVPQVWIKQLDRGPAALLATDGGAAGWSPNGKEVAFYGNGAIWRASADGSSLPVRAWPIGQTAGGGPPSYSPDGQWIVATTTGNIVAFKTSGDTAGLSLVESPSLARRGTLSPDGHWLAYESDESGRLEVYVRPFPNAQSAKRQISVGGGSGPRWSRSGRELFYVDDRRDLIAVPVTLAPTFAAGVPHRLFSIQPFLFIGYDPSPDGQRFLTVRAVGADLTRPPELVVVQNFVEELRAKVPR